MHRRLVAAVCLGSALAAMAACVLVEPLPELPVPPPRRPSIVAASVSPPSSVVLTDLAESTSFVVPVEAEADETLRWRVFVDYGHDQALIAGRPDTDLPPIAGTSTRRFVDFSLSNTLLGDPRACHTVTLFVAYEFEVNQTPKANDGDVETWFYQPRGAYAGCPGFEGGAPDAAAFIDAASSLDGAIE